MKFLLNRGSQIGMLKVMDYSALQNLTGTKLKIIQDFGSTCADKD